MRGRWFRLFAAVAFATQPVLITGGAAPVAAAPPAELAAAPLAEVAAAPLAATSTFTLSVTAARSASGGPAGNVTKGQAVTTYKWLINVDDSGDSTQRAPGTAQATVDPVPGNPCSPDTNPAYGLYGEPVSYPITTPLPPAGSTLCNWPSVHPVHGSTTAGVYTQGDQTTLNSSTGLSLPTGPTPACPMCNGKYLISVLATGYKLGGQLFTLPVSGGVVSVALQPMPLPSSTIRAVVFNDLLTNGEYDQPGDLPLQGFRAHLYDAWGNEVTNDVWGNPLCTQYVLGTNGKPTLDASGKPTVSVVGGKCLSDANGQVLIPYMPENKYSVIVVPPDGQQTCTPQGPATLGCWVQTSTLEGGHDWDTWQLNGDPGYGAETLVGNELVPEVLSGWVTPTWLAGYPNSPVTGTPSTPGAIKGTVLGLGGYSPPAGGLAFGGEAGNKVTGPIASPWLALASLTANDINVFVGQGNPDGTFNITHVPDGDYVLAVWDGEQNMLMEAEEVSVVNGQTTDMGVFYVLHWFGTIEGTVCVNSSGNGKCNPGDQGIPNLTLNILGRDNTLFDGGTVAATTDANGHYIFRQAYPPGQWYIEQAYFEKYKTIGVTYKSENQAQAPCRSNVNDPCGEVTVLGTGVDVNVLSMVGGHSRIDWAVQPYAPGTNGGIVGEMVYDSTRFQTDPRNIQSAQPPHEAGMPGIPVNLYAPIPCPTTTPAPGQCETSPNGFSYTLAADGSYAKGKLLNQYTSEAWQRPNIANPAAEVCVDRDSLGNPQGNPPPRTPPGSPPQAPYFGFEPTAPNTDCLESFVAEQQVITNFGSPSGNSTVNGNYGFTIGCPLTAVTCNPFDPADPAKVALGTPTLPVGDYIVEPQITCDPTGIGNDPTGARIRMVCDPVTNKPHYVPSAEEDVNIFNNTQIVPQLPPFPCVGPLHKVHVTNPDFLAAGGSPFEGQMRHLCGDKLIAVANQRSATPNFYWHTATDVPVPGRFHGLITDDFNLSVNPREINYGEKAGIPRIPIGIYDFTNRLVTTLNTDPNGEFDVILPSSWQNNCLNPTSSCPNVYHFVSNDPGVPGAANPNYNPAYRTLTAEFQTWPNDVNYADLAPWAIHFAIEGPGTIFGHPAQCALDTTQPVILAVSQPYVNGSGSFTIYGYGFGAENEDFSRVTLNGSIAPFSIGAWSDTQITVNIPNTMPAGAYQLMVTNALNNTTINGLTFHVLGAGYNPQVFEVGPGKPYSTIQSGIEAAAPVAQALVVVYPNTPNTGTPLGNYYENIVIHSPLKLQGVGPGGVRPDGSNVLGSIIDGFGFENRTAYATAWRALVAGLRWNGYQTVDEGQVVYILSLDGQWTAGYPPAIDGFTIQGGDQLTFPSRINDNGGDPLPLSEREATAIVAQGGGVYVNAYARYEQITNNVIQGNGGSYGGAIRVGTPGPIMPPDPGAGTPADGHNDNIRIAYNRILWNGGHLLAGAIGLFAGTNGYQVDHNDMCGNFSSEYGGAISHFGNNSIDRGPGDSASKAGNSIHDNKIYFNGAYDHGGGIAILGEQPANPASQLSPGTGAVDVYNNIIEGNLSNDDGGGVVANSVEQYQLNIYNNFIVNNVATHEGGGLALDDAPFVNFNSNTVMKNITTGTSVHGTGAPAPAGLSTVLNSNLLQSSLPAGSPKISSPLMFNNIFWDNRAGTYQIAVGTQPFKGITGIGGSGDPNPIQYWDMGVADNSGQLLSPTNSVLHDATGASIGGPYAQADASNKTSDPQVKSIYATSIQALPWRGDPHFVGTITVAQEVPIIRAGDYHLSGPGSPAFHLGAGSKNGVNAPAFDIDYDPRPSGDPLGWEAGADQIPAGDVEPEPATPVLDTFNRANVAATGTSPQPLGPNWGGNAKAPFYGFFGILNSAVQVINSGFTFWTPSGSPAACTPTSTAPGCFGARQEAYFKFIKVGTGSAPNVGVTDQDLLLKVTGPSSGTTSAGTAMIEVQYDATNHAIYVSTFDQAGAGWQTQATISKVTFNNGDRFGAKTFADGSVFVYQNGLRIGSVNVTSNNPGAVPWPKSYAKGGGAIGMWFISSGSMAAPNDVRVTNYGGGTLP